MTDINNVNCNANNEKEKKQQTKQHLNYFNTSNWIVCSIENTSFEKQFEAEFFIYRFCVYNIILHIMWLWHIYSYRFLNEKSDFLFLVF